MRYPNLDGENPTKQKSVQCKADTQCVHVFQTGCIAGVPFETRARYIFYITGCGRARNRLLIKTNHAEEYSKSIQLF